MQIATGKTYCQSISVAVFARRFFIVDGVLIPPIRKKMRLQHVTVSRSVLALCVAVVVVIGSGHP